MSFFDALLLPGNAFLRNALFAALLASISFGAMGSLVVTRRITYLTGALAHCVLGGIGFAIWAQNRLDWAWLTPMRGALLAAVLAAVLLWVVERKAHQRSDTVISVIWTAGMALGILFIAASQAFVDPMSYLFGDILMIGRRDLLLVVVLDILVVGAVLWHYPIFLALSFDEEWAALRGVRTGLYSLLLLLLAALTIVMLVSLVGIILAIALLTLPAAIASRCTRSLWKMMLLAALLSMVLSTGGLGMSYSFDMPTGPTIVLLAAAAWVATWLVTLRRN